MAGSSAAAEQATVLLRLVCAGLALPGTAMGRGLVVRVPTSLLALRLPRRGAGEEEREAAPRKRWRTRSFPDLSLHERVLHHVLVYRKRYQRTRSSANNSAKRKPVTRNGPNGMWDFEVARRPSTSARLNRPPITNAAIMPTSA